MEITAETGSEAYLKLLRELVHRGEPVAARGLPTRELRDVTIRITTPGEAHVLRTTRGPSASIVATEAIHLIGGLSSLEQLDLASGGRFSQFADNGRLRGAYGPRTHAQMERVAELLARDTPTRQAVASVWLGDEGSAGHDVPCTLSYQFFARGKVLHLRTSMRSNDVILGFPYDIEVAGALLGSMATALGWATGQVTHTVGSMHIYDTDVARAMVITPTVAGDLTREPAPAVTAPPLAGDWEGTPAALARWKWQRTARSAEAVALRAEFPDVTELNSWYIKYTRELPSAASGWEVCGVCRYVTDGQCRECEVTM